MGTFVEFYQTLLGFVNFRLYTSVGLVYPPKFNQSSDDQGAELAAFTLEGNTVGPLEQLKLQMANGGSNDAPPDPKLQAEIDKLMLQLNNQEKDMEQNKEANTAEVEEQEEEQATEAIDKFEPVAPGGDILPQPAYSTTDPSTLFSSLTFFLSRETPRQPLEFILRAFGCKRIGWDAVLGDGAFSHNEFDSSITHQVVDRPLMQAPQSEAGNEPIEDNQTAQRLRPSSRVPGRIYVQPQWIWDSINDEELKRPDLYAPGAQLPPHLSPFVKKVRGQYDPSQPLADQEREDEELEADSDLGDEPDVSEDEEESISRNAKNNVVSDNGTDETAEGMEVARLEDGSEPGSEDGSELDSFGGFSDDDSASDDEATSAALQRQRELEAELTGVALEEKEVDPKAKARADARKKAARRRREEEEELERAKMMMSRKKRKILEKMVYSNKKKDAEAEGLRAKRRKIEKQREKVERLAKNS